jgi:D-aminopeptidase
MERKRARELGIVLGALPTGERNAITDVTGVRVGHATLVEGDAVRTGVTVVLGGEEPLFAGAHRLNGNGELTGLEWVRESGMLTTPVGVTNTHSVGVVRDALVAAARAAARPSGAWSLPVVGETWDGVLNDIDGMHVRAEHVAAALADASDEAVLEGNVGGGTGMICHGFKGGIGTSSRVVEEADGAVVGVLVQANYGRRKRLRIDGVPVGEEIRDAEVPAPAASDGAVGGSIIALVATDAPLLPGQCERLAQRAGLGVARMGGVGEDSSGDLFLAFATGNRGLGGRSGTVPLRMLPNERMTPLFDAVVEATEEAIVNALCAAETMTGLAGSTAYAIPLDRLTTLFGPAVQERRGA